MTQKEETVSHLEAQDQPSKPASTSKKVTDHLANERTFLAWIRTGLATIAFGFVVERFGLLLRELGIKTTTTIPVHLSSFFGIALTLLGVIMMIVALMNFLHIRRSIDAEQFHPRTAFAVLLTVLASLIGILLAIYLLLTA
jgi:putative membrane protein